MSSSTNNLVKSIGHHGHWGFSAGFDIIDAYWKSRDQKIIQSEIQDQKITIINVLLIQPCDIRHILQFLYKRRSVSSGKQPYIVHFYLYETVTELLTRDILLLEILHDIELPLRQRANLFLEIFGNLKLQRRTAKYIEQVAQKLKLFMNPTKTTSNANEVMIDVILDLSLLKYRDRDYLIESFSQYNLNTKFDIDKLYDHRLRGLYEERYDSRKALNDWDYHAVFKSKASIIHIKLYKQWRENGIAFEFGDQSYVEPNRTLVSYTEGTMKAGKEKGIKKEVKGYWGDVVCSPYIAFGVDCDTSTNGFAEGLFEILNKNTGTEQHRHHTVEIALFNLFGVLWSIEHPSVYSMQRGNDIYSGLGRDDQKEGEDLDVVGKEEQPDQPKLVKGEENKPQSVTEKEDLVLDDVQVEVEKADEQDPPPKTLSNPPGNVGKEVKKPFEVLQDMMKLELELSKMLERSQNMDESLHSFKFIPLTGSPLDGVLGKSRFDHLFDCVFVSTRGSIALTSEVLPRILKEDGLLAVETAKYIIPVQKDLKAELIRKEEQLVAEKLNWHRIPAPIKIRHRDEQDDEDDVLFFQK